MNLIAAVKGSGLNPLTIDKESVGAFQVIKDILAVAFSNFRMFSGNFRVVNLENITRFPPDGNNGFPDFKAETLVIAANDEKERHEMLGKVGDRA